MVLPTGTRYKVNGVEFELLGPSTQRDDGSYTVPARLSVVTGQLHDAPGPEMADWQSLDLREGVTLPDEVEPAQVKLDPYAEHRRKIGDDK
jgi:hypothetical protein